MMTFDSLPIPNLLGTAALVLYFLTLLPTNLRTVFPETRKSAYSKNLLKHRRTIGVLSFICVVFHGWILASKRDIDLHDPRTFWIYFQGISTFIIFAMLAITSNDWSIKRLKKNWKRLHQLTYVAMFILVWHIWDKMSGHFTYMTPINLLIIASITVLYVMRFWKEKFGNNQKPKPPKTGELSASPS